ncbi:MAG: hypothetical protein K0M60_02845 [Hydrogenophaga sp.]|nr:hypothetical protein [Hydrogenophaga sp.]
MNAATLAVREWKGFFIGLSILLSPYYFYHCYSYHALGPNDSADFLHVALWASACPALRAMGLTDCA